MLLPLARKASKSFCLMLMMRSAIAFNSKVHSLNKSLIMKQSKTQGIFWESMISRKNVTDVFHCHPVKMYTVKTLYPVNYLPITWSVLMINISSPWEKNIKNSAFNSLASQFILFFFKLIEPGMKKSLEHLPVPQNGSNNRCAVNGWIWIHGPDHKFHLALNPACHISCLADLESIWKLW